tara:strand:- start:54 stop:179 length:126 start_codon:yes stop_codon:yes gene_type:complete
VNDGRERTERIIAGETVAAGQLEEWEAACSKEAVPMFGVCT